MKSIFQGIALLCLILSDTLQLQAAFSDSSGLKPGDKAPPLSLARWIKGDSIAHFEEGKVYLIEFSFIYCLPCQTSIPHLSALTKKYAGQVDVIGVHIWENNKDSPQDISYIRKVQNFVKSMGSKISYAVAVDQPEQTTANTWGGGAPKVFIIDRHQTVVWIGHPVDMDPIVESVVKDQFDYHAAANKQVEELNDRTKRMEQIYADKSNGNYDLAIAEMDRLIADYPKETGLYYEKYDVLDGMDANNERANASVRWLLAHKPPGFPLMYKLAHLIIDSKYPDYKLALLTANDALATANNDLTTALIFDVMGRAYFRMGNRPMGIKMLNKGINLLKPDTPQLRDARHSMQERLRKYKLGM